jgi:hypothetical protein
MARANVLRTFHTVQQIPSRNEELGCESHNSLLRVGSDQELFGIIELLA